MSSHAPIIAPPEPVRVLAPRSRRLTWYYNGAAVLLMHVFAVMAIWRGGSWKLWLACAIAYFVRMFGITGVYHRYFSHRSYKTSRALQLVLAVLGTTAAQKGPLWWASTHRAHHRYSDTERDVHSPMRKGFWYSHMGWWLGADHERGRIDLIRDYGGYPELVWLDKYHWLPPSIFAALTLIIGGVDGFLWVGALSTVLLAHATFTINSLSHVFGSRRFATTDTSRNNLGLALLTMGEGWHNNHHHYMNSANQGFYWWEVDLTYYALCAMEKVGLVWDVRRPPKHVLTKNLLAEVGERCELLLPEREPTPAPIAAPIAAATAEPSA
jgi:stearoyl-CoA desaturase (Delta-9 desaturase)